jgi:predicted P-loop ATPase
MNINRITPIADVESVGKVESIRNWIDENYEVQINIFDNTKSFITSKSREYAHPITENDIYLHMIDENIACGRPLLKAIITNPNQMKAFNPIMDYFSSLDGKYNGNGEIEHFCQHIVSHDFQDNKDGHYQDRLMYLIKKWLVATVAGIYGQHCNDVMIGFINAKGGIGKSTLIKWLVPECLQDYYTISDRDESVFKMTDCFATKFIINFDEFVGITKATENSFKKNMSLSEMDRKLPGESFTTRVPRIASCAFTSNKTQEMGGFLFNSDNGLLRRIACIEIDDIDQTYSEELDVNQIWAEALMLFHNTSFDFIWNKTDFEEFTKTNQRYVIETSATKLIKEYYRLPCTNDIPVFKMPSEILRDLRNARKIHHNDRVDEQGIGQALRMLGFERVSQRINKSPRYGYYVMQLYA